ncbi:MAG TPA: hypothetical protein VFA89_19270 [Terriglobales bacterium]|nr:hypothetical protein [Terriglobales bacterium]
MALHYGFGDLITIDARHVEVEDNCVKVFFAGDSNATGTVKRNENFMSVLFEDGFVKYEDTFVIVDAENGGHAGQGQLQMQKLSGLEF